MSHEVRIGVVQPVGVAGIPPYVSDLAGITALVEKNISHHLTFIPRAAEQGVHILCFPEDVCGIAGIAARGKDEKVFRSVVQSVGDSTLQVFCEAACSAKMYVIATACLMEQDEIYNTAVLIGPNGQIVGRYRKTHVPPGEDRYLASGVDMPVFETDLGRIGLLICWDLMFPETTRVLALNGAEIVFCPTLGFDFGGEDMGEMRMRVRAFDNAVYLATSMYAVSEADRPGRSCIVGPDGKVLADARYTPDTIVWADIDPHDRLTDCADEQGGANRSMWDRWALSRRPRTYKAIHSQGDTSI